jgi:hypothetical protein
LQLAQGHGFADWVDVDASKMSGVFKRIPDRGDLPAGYQRIIGCGAVLQVIDSEGEADGGCI